jgi:hypothetical protein
MRYHSDHVCVCVCVCVCLHKKMSDRLLDFFEHGMNVLPLGPTSYW